MTEIYLPGLEPMDCPECGRHRSLRFGLYPGGAPKVRCAWCGWDNSVTIPGYIEGN